LPGRRVLHLTAEEVQAIHQGLLGRFGGAAGVRDAGLLESALFRPRTGYYEDIAAMATALLESLIMNRPFLDGNKRVAYFATDVFLRLNGWKLAVVPEQAHTFLIGLLESGCCDYAHLLEWLQQSMRPVC